MVGGSARQDKGQALEGFEGTLVVGQRRGSPERVDGALERRPDRSLSVQFRTASAGVVEPGPRSELKLLRGVRTSAATSADFNPAIDGGHRREMP